MEDSRICEHPVCDIVCVRWHMCAGVSARAAAPFVWSHTCILCSCFLLPSVSLSLFLSLCSFFLSLRRPSFSSASVVFKGIFVTSTCARGTGRLPLWMSFFAVNRSTCLLFSASFSSSPLYLSIAVFCSLVANLLAPRPCMKHTSRREVRHLR